MTTDNGGTMDATEPTLGDEWTPHTMSERTFSAKDGLHFTRKANGEVVVWRDDPANSVLLDDYTWISAVCAMTPHGENPDVWRWAKNLHLRGVPEADAPA